MKFNPIGGKISGNNISAMSFLLDSIYRKSGCRTHGEVETYEHCLAENLATVWHWRRWTIRPGFALFMDLKSSKLILNIDLILDEFALSCYLIKLKLEGYELPNQLPMHLIPPSKRTIPESSSQSQPVVHSSSPDE